MVGEERWCWGDGGGYSGVLVPYGVRGLGRVGE